jgi:hypothetical protein
MICTHRINPACGIPRFLSRFARRAGLVTLRQTFVRRSHGGQLSLPGGSTMSNGTSSALNSEQDLALIPMAGGGLSRLAIARLERAGVPVASLLKRVGLTPEAIADPEERLSVRQIFSAILDADLKGRSVSPVTDALVAGDIRFVFVTGCGDHGSSTYRDRPTLNKPFQIGALKRALQERLGTG